MKKKLEAELISIAHRILKLKNKSELDQLHLEVRNLYEKLTVLKFVEENFANAQPTIGYTEVKQTLETAFEEKPEATDNYSAGPEIAVAGSEKPSEDEKPEEEPEVIEEEKIQEPEQPEKEKLDEELTPAETPLEKEAEEVIAEVEDEIANADQAEGPLEEMSPTQTDGIAFEQPEAKEEVAAAVDTAEPALEDLFKPTFEWAFEPKTDKADDANKESKPQVAFEDLLGKGYVDPVFVKPDELKTETPEISEPKKDVIPISRIADKIPVFKMGGETAEKAVSLNDRLSKGITVGLNDRIAFVKNLFNNSNEDYNRVLSQLITFDTYGEAQDFINNMIKPDYNNWEGKDDYAQRFMEVVEKKFT